MKPRATFPGSTPGATTADPPPRAVKCLGPEQIAGRKLLIDGYNLLITVESALSGGLLIRARDGCIRDLASIHGAYRKVDETRRAIERIGSMLAQRGAVDIHWLLDEPVSGSGRLRGLLLECAGSQGGSWRVDLHPNPDRVLSVSGDCVITADSTVLDRAACWYNAAAEIAATVEGAWLIDLSLDSDEVPDAPMPHRCG